MIDQFKEYIANGMVGMTYEEAINICADLTDWLIDVEIDLQKRVSDAT